MTTLAVTSVNSLLCQASTCFRIGSKLRCIRSTPTEMQSMSENDFECFASTGVNGPETMFQIGRPTDLSSQIRAGKLVSSLQHPHPPIAKDHESLLKVCRLAQLRISMKFLRR